MPLNWLEPGPAEFRGIKGVDGRGGAGGALDEWDRRDGRFAVEDIKCPFPAVEGVFRAYGDALERIVRLDPWSRGREDGVGPIEDAFVRMEALFGARNA